MKAVMIVAVTKIIKIVADVESCLNYITNSYKTEDQELVTYDGCSEATVPYIFEQANMMNPRYGNGENSVKAYHIIQSFSKTDDITPEKANQIGLELMDRLFDKKYSFVCATHTDHDHIHNHILICAAERTMTGKKINDNLSLLHKLRRTSDELCKENGLEVISVNGKSGKNYREWYEDINNPNGSKKTQLRNLIDTKIKTSIDFDDFIKQMKEAGAGIEYVNSAKYGRVIKYKLPNSSNKDRWIRSYNLGPGYADKVIARRIDEWNTSQKQQSYSTPAKSTNKPYKSLQERIVDKNKLKIKSMLDVSKDGYSKETYNLRKWKNRQNVMLAEKIKSEVIEKYGIDYTQIKGKIRSLEVENNYLERSLQEEGTHNFAHLIECCKIYAKTFKIADEYESCSNKEQFYQEHVKELNAYFDAEDFITQTKIIPFDILRSNPDKYIDRLEKALSDKYEKIRQTKEQIKENKETINELKHYQNELDVYHGRKTTSRSSRDCI